MLCEYLSEAALQHSENLDDVTAIWTWRHRFTTILACQAI
jgi:hypothetical protein